MIQRNDTTPESKPGIPSTLLFVIGGAAVILVGALPLLFMVGVLKTTPPARTDPLFLLGTALIGAFVALGVLMIVYSRMRSRAVFVAIATIAAIWGCILAAYVAWRAS